jgi:hypothetical protein
MASPNRPQNKRIIDPVTDKLDLVWDAYFARLETQIAAFDASDAPAAQTTLRVGYGVFHAHRNDTDQTGLTAGIDNAINWTTESFDTDSVFDLTTDRFTPLVAGIYHIHLSVSSATGTGGETCAAAIYKNGANICYGNYLDASGSSEYTSLASIRVSMNGSTDYIEGRVYLPTAITTLDGDALVTFIDGHLVRAT